MNKFAKLAALLFVFALICAPVAAFAQEGAAPDAATSTAEGEGSTAPVAAGVDLTPLYGVGCGIVLFGSALGIGRIGAQSVESMARQPEAAGKIQTAMIISAALIEGVTFFALIICMLK